MSCFIAVEKGPCHQPQGDLYDLPPQLLVGFACYKARIPSRLGVFAVSS